MDYIELNFSMPNGEDRDILLAELSEFAFEGFQEQEFRVIGYIPRLSLADCKESVDILLAKYGVTECRYIVIENQNWNALWESSITPINIADRIYFRAPFHEPKEDTLNIIIMPKMSFGTGHHTTTRLVSRFILDMDVEGKQGLDMGSGTGVLSIIAALRGASHLDAVDIDEWAYENSKENLSFNNISEDIITPILGGAKSIEGRNYDFILANINRNILLNDMSLYVSTLKSGGDLVMSGFLESDVEILSAKISELGLEIVASRMEDGWVSLRCHKPQI